MAHLLLGLLAQLALAGPITVPNGGFEEGLARWQAAEPEDFVHGELSIVTDDVQGGRQALRIANPRADGKVMVGAISEMIPLPADTRTFTLSLWMKSAQLPEMVELRIASTDAEGRWLSPWNEHAWRFVRPPLEPTLGQWHRITTDFPAMNDWGGFALTIWVRGAGADVLIDEIEVSAVDPEDWAVPSVGARLPDPGAGVALWTEGPLRKVYPDEPPAAAPGEGLALAAAGGERDVAQLAIRSERPLPGATLTFSDLAGPAPLPASVLRAEWVGLTEVAEPRSGRARLGPTPDPLLPEPALDLPAGETRVLWITAHIPRGTAAGVYTGTAALRAGDISADVPVSLRVYGFDLPERPALRTIARIWQYHQGHYGAFVDSLAEHRCSGTNILGVEQRDGGTFPLWGIDARREGDQVVVDTARLHEAAESFRARGLGVFNVPRIFLGDASGLFSKDGTWLGFEVFTPEFDAAYASYAGQVADALRAEGLLPYALWQIWDEPQNEEMERQCLRLASLVKQAAPDARVYLTAGVHDALLDVVDIWNLPWPSRYSSTAAAKARERGAELWAYQNDLYSLDTPDSSLQMALFPWRLRRYDVVGVEWWAISQWESSPWESANPYEPQNGGGYFLYPHRAEAGPPVSSIRWELYREGVEDYDVLTLLEQHDAPAMAELVEGVALGPDEVVRDPRAVAAAQQAARARVEGLLGR